MRKCIVVLGMHRSGTSAMAGLLEIFGVYLGDNLLMEGNDERGLKQFENKEIYQLNEKLLGSVGSSWDDVENIPVSKFNNGQSKKLIKEISESIKEEYAGEEIFCIKDPRISLLIPIYRKIFKKLKIEPHFIIMKRDSMEIARSLEERNGFLFSKSLSLCDKYYDCIDRNMSKIDAICIEFSDLIKNTKENYLMIQKKFNINFNPFSKKISDNFLDPKLKHYDFNYNNYQGVRDLMYSRDKTILKKNKEIHDRLKEISLISSQNIENENMVKFMSAELDSFGSKLAGIENSLTWRLVKRLDGITRPLFNMGILNRKKYKWENANISNTKIAVLFHLYYEDLWEEISEYIDNIPVEFDLYVNLVEGHSEHIFEKIKARYPGCKITVSKNLGYDMGGLINALNSVDLRKYDLICKIHTKKADYRHDGSIWRLKLLDSILGSRERVSNILKTFKSNKNVGIIGSNDFINRDSMGSNLLFYNDFCEKLGIPLRKRNLNFVAGSIFWCRPKIIEELKKLKLKIEDFEEPNSLDGQKAHALERIFGAISNKLGYSVNGIESTYRFKNQSVSLHKNDRIDDVKPICFYLPQYHVIPENEVWWGKGFTEWDNVKKGRPLFENHYQPRLPGNLGYYNLDDSEVIAKQIRLAKENGIYGFCYYYYWFDGKKLLNKPIERMLENKKLDFPFCICWANENWTRAWDGKEDEILMKQTFSKEDCKNFIEEMSKYFLDPRYITINEKPLLVLYRIDNVPYPKKFIKFLREAALNMGFEIHISLVQSFSKENPKKYGIDSAIEFPPSKPVIGSSKKKVSNLNKDFKGEIFDYNHVFQKFSQRRKEDYTLFFGTTPGWDNTARRDNKSVILINSGPDNYKRWLEHAIVKTKNYYLGDERLIFINAWNEWGEGCYLEPDAKYGDNYLKVTREVLDKYKIVR